MKYRKDAKIKKDGRVYTGGTFEVNSLDELPYDPKSTIKKGSKIIKCAEESKGDPHPIGTTGITVGSYIVDDGQECYMVKWDNSPHKIPGTEITLGFVVGWKIKESK